MVPSNQILKNSSKRILMVVTSCDRIDSNHQTGLWYDEFAIPFNIFKSQGFEVSVASPRGGNVPIDPQSESRAEGEEGVLQSRNVLRQTLQLSEVQASRFDAIFLPGGHGTMFDLAENPTLQQLLSDFAQQEKIIAAVCHGPAGFVGARLPDGTPLVAGKTITAFTNNEEHSVGLDSLMPFLLESRLRELGAHFVAEPNWASHVERDGLLVTGQNPQSSAKVAMSVLELLVVDKFTCSC